MASQFTPTRSASILNDQQKFQHARSLRYQAAAMAKITRNEVLLSVQEVTACHPASHGVQIRYLAGIHFANSSKRSIKQPDIAPRDNVSHARQNKVLTFAPAPSTGVIRSLLQRQNATYAVRKGVCLFSSL